jgi:outer membrane lipoprotein carrier protein
MKGVEARYNRAKTLRVDFEQRYTSQGRGRLETGQLVLSKPGRMRWDYAQPAGKVFLSDGKWVWFYSPAVHRAEKARLKESDDLRTPLAFLLGKLDFRSSFRDFEFRESDGEAVLAALPKSERAPFIRVLFAVSADNAIRRLVVEGVDGSVQEFRFANEQLNPKVSEAIFRFAVPAGAEVAEVREFGEQEK